MLAACLQAVNAGERISALGWCDCTGKVTIACCIFIDCAMLTL